MTVRPVYLVSKDTNRLLISRNIDFKWHRGLSISQKQKSILSLHKAITEQTEISNILEISSKSFTPIGVQSSAFNLKIEIKKIKASVENIYQGSKVFEHGGPFNDLYLKSAVEAKTDQRIKENGALKYFLCDNEEWKLNEDFYSWIYLNALMQNKSLMEKILTYDAFTDIEFNPKKSINTQAYSAALITGAYRKSYDLVKSSIPSNFKKIFKPEIVNPFELTQ